MNKTDARICHDTIDVLIKVGKNNFKTKLILIINLKGADTSCYISNDSEAKYLDLFCPKFNVI